MPAFLFFNYPIYFFFTSAASASNIPQKVNDSHNPILSLASFMLFKNLGMCNNRNHPPIIMPESKAAQYLVCGINKPTPPAIKHTPQK